MISRFMRAYAVMALLAVLGLAVAVHLHDTVGVVAFTVALVSATVGLIRGWVRGVR